MIFRQLFEPLSCTYTYLVGCPDSGEAILVDPTYVRWEEDLDILRSLGLGLMYTLETHVHADHITAALKLREMSGCKIGFPAASRCAEADMQIEAGQLVSVGSVDIRALATPGHTDDHLSYYLGDRVLTGDALLIDGCGRTDFQNGNPATLYHSIHQQLFKLPDDTLVFPGHDYQQRHVSSVLQEKQRNPRVGQSKTEAEFIELMNTLDLAYPKFIDYAVPGNRKGGVCPDDLPDNLEKYCQQSSESPQG